VKAISFAGASYLEVGRSTKSMAAMGRMLPVSRRVVSDNNQPSATVGAQSLHKAVFSRYRHPCGAQKSPTTRFFLGSLGWVAGLQSKQT